MGPVTLFGIDWVQMDWKELSYVTDHNVNKIIHYAHQYSEFSKDEKVPQLYFSWVFIQRAPRYHITEIFACQRLLQHCSEELNC